MPQNLVMQDVEVTYGPGQPTDRWYTDVGGRVEYTPIQPTVDRHLSAAVTDGPYGQQNFAFVGNTGTFKGWSTVAGRRRGTRRRLSSGAGWFRRSRRRTARYSARPSRRSRRAVLLLAVLYAKGGGYRAQVIPTTDIGLVEPGSGIHYSQATSGFYSSLPFADYNKYDTNEMFMGYARQQLFLSHTSTLENSAWYNHIRRFHRRNEDALAQGAQVDEWNNPHSNMFGDQIGLSQVLPLTRSSSAAISSTRSITRTTSSTIPPMEAAEPSRSSAQGRNSAPGYFQQDNVTFFAQDDFHPIPQIHIIPSVRVDGFCTSYSDQAARDFTFAPSTYFVRKRDGTATAV